MTLRERDLQVMGRTSLLLGDSIKIPSKVTSSSEIPDPYRNRVCVLGGGFRELDGHLILDSLIDLHSDYTGGDLMENLSLAPPPTPLLCAQAAGPLRPQPEAVLGKLPENNVSGPSA